MFFSGNGGCGVIILTSGFLRDTPAVDADQPVDCDQGGEPQADSTEGVGAGEALDDPPIHPIAHPAALQGHVLTRKHVGLRDGIEWAGGDERVSRVHELEAPRSVRVADLLARSVDDFVRVEGEPVEVEGDGIPEGHEDVPRGVSRWQHPDGSVPGRGGFDSGEVLSQSSDLAGPIGPRDFLILGDGEVARPVDADAVHLRESLVLGLDTESSGGQSAGGLHVHVTNPRGWVKLPDGEAAAVVEGVVSPVGVLVQVML